MIRSFRGVAPRIAATALVTPVADVLGDVLLEAGAVVLDGAVVEVGAAVSPGAVVTPGTRIPPAVLVAGVPARVLRPLTAEEQARFAAAAAAWRTYAARFKATARPVPVT